MPFNRLPAFAVQHGGDDGRCGGDFVRDPIWHIQNLKLKNARVWERAKGALDVGIQRPGNEFPDPLGIDELAVVFIVENLGRECRILLEMGLDLGGDVVPGFVRVHVEIPYRKTGL